MTRSMHSSATWAPETSLQTTSEGLEIAINDGWRVIEDELQWILQRWQTPAWRNRSYCRTRSGLERCIREYCGPVDPIAQLQLDALEDWHG